MIMVDPTYSKIYLTGFAAGKEKTEKILREVRRKEVAAGTAAAKKGAFVLADLRNHVLKSSNNSRLCGLMGKSRPELQRTNLVLHKTHFFDGVAIQNRRKCKSKKL